MNNIPHELTTRNYFAGLAMQSILNKMSIWNVNKEDLEKISSLSFKIADEMIKSS